jgi:hypothetical protein
MDGRTWVRAGRRDGRYRIAPIRRQHASAHVAVEGRMWPVLNPYNQPVFDWIAVDVVEVRAQIAFIVHRSLPAASLPDTALALCQPTGRLRFAARNAARRVAMCSISTPQSRCSRFTVKKYAPPGTQTRR